TLIQDSSSISGDAGTQGHDLVLVAQRLVSPSGSVHPRFTSVVALVSVEFDHIAQQGTVTEPVIVTLGELFLTALYSDHLTDVGNDEAFLQAAGRALSLAAAEAVQTLESEGYEVVSSDVIQLTLAQSPQAGLTALFAGSVQLKQPGYNGQQITLNGYFYKDPV